MSEENRFEQVWARQFNLHKEVWVLFKLHWSALRIQCSPVLYMPNMALVVQDG